MQMTTSEARAEACTIVIRLLLPRLAPDVVEMMHIEAIDEALNIGHPDITEEVGWIFHVCPWQRPPTWPKRRKRR